MEEKVEDVFPEAATLFGYVCGLVRVLGQPAPSDERSNRLSQQSVSNYYAIKFTDEQWIEFIKVSMAASEYYSQLAAYGGEGIGPWDSDGIDPPASCSFPTNFALSPQDSAWIQAVVKTAGAWFDKECE